MLYPLSYEGLRTDTTALRDTTRYERNSASRRRLSAQFFNSNSMRYRDCEASDRVLVFDRSRL